MDPVEQEELQGMHEFRRAGESSKRALLSISVSVSLLLLVSLSSWLWLPALLGHASTHFSLFLIHLPDGIQVDRITVFFLCNVILVVVARDSGLLCGFFPGEDQPCGEGDPQPVKTQGHLHRGLADDSSEAKSEGSVRPLQVSVLEKSHDFGAGGEEEEVVEDDGCCSDVDELSKRFEDFIQKVKRERTMEKSHDFGAGGEEEEVVEDDGCCSDVDELNKRFEDFIQKVKRERTMETL